MFESAILVIDRLISLVKTREEAQKTLFKDVIDPLFIETEKAYQDYTRFLMEAQSTVDAILQGNSGSDLSAVLTPVIRRRADFQAVRAKVRVLAEVFGQKNADSDVAGLFLTTMHLFQPNTGLSSNPKIITDLFVNLIKDQNTHQGDAQTDAVLSASLHIRSCLSSAESDWEYLCEQYATVKMRLVRPL